MCYNTSSKSSSLKMFMNRHDLHVMQEALGCGLVMHSTGYLKGGFNATF